MVTFTSRQRFLNYSSPLGVSRAGELFGGRGGMKVWGFGLCCLESWFSKFASMEIFFSSWCLSQVLPSTRADLVVIIQLNSRRLRQGFRLNC